MNKVYAVGVIKYDKLENASYFFIKNQRLWALFSKFEDAEQCVLENRGDLFEFYYNLACIEEINIIDYSNKENEAPSTPKQWWYKITFFSGGDHNDDVVEKIEQPEWMKNICNVWVG
jgi:hypothetical protein